MKTTLGYAEATDLFTSFPAVWIGTVIDAPSILVRYTFLGDTNLDGQVDLTDLSSLADAWQSQAQWFGGDFDHSGFVDLGDLTMLAANWQAGMGAPTGPSLADALASFGLPSVSVPEPAALALAWLGGFVLRRCGKNLPRTAKLTSSVRASA